MIDAVVLRLSCLGHSVGATDIEALEQAIDLAREEILRAVNLDEVPSGMQGVLIERACLHFLRGVGLTSVSLGDASFRFANSLPGVARYRRMVW